MDTRKVLNPLFAVSALTTIAAAHVVIRAQAKKLQEWKSFSQSVVDAVGVFEPYAPDEVKLKVREDLEFARIARKF